jgi:hypothetical protein
LKKSETNVKKSYLGHLSSFRPDVVHFQPFLVLSDVEVGVEVAVVAVDGVEKVVVVR